MNDSPCRLFVGVDWAAEEHQVCVLRPSGEIVLEKSFAHSGDGLAEFVQSLERLSCASLQEVRVGIEVPHGPVVDILLERGCQVFSINPKQSDRFRDRFSPAGAKDDRRDAYVIADSLRTDPQCFRRLQVEEPTVLELREWSRMYEELKHEEVRHTNRLRGQLRRYYPQYLELTDDLGKTWFLQLWKRVPTPQEARKVSAKAVANILKKNKIRRITAPKVLETLRTKPLSVAAGTVEAAVAHIRLVVDRLEVVKEQIRQCERTLDALIKQLSDEQDDTAETDERHEQRDAEILRSLPGVGRIVLATLLAEAAEPLRRRSYHSLRALAGVAPVTLRSGKSCFTIRMRRGCHQRLREACYHWARVAMQRDPVSRETYKRLRQKGKNHARALRSVADRLLSVACSMLRHGTLYDPARARARVTTKASGLCATTT